MKKMEFFSCGSSASTAVCSSLDRRSIVRHGPTRPIDHRHQFHMIPCTSQLLPINPKLYYVKHRKSTSSTTTTCSAHSKQNHNDLDQIERRKSSADVHDLRSSTPLGNSSRFLLVDDQNSSHEGLTFVDWLSSEDHHHHRSDGNGGRRSPCLSRSLSTRDHHGLSDINHALKPPSFSSSSSLSSTRSLSSKGSISLRSPSSSAPSGGHHREQVVVLMVSLHCKGCEGKVRKHISKMEGVKSFSIDLATKKVIVVGDLSPLDVVASVSKVKSAQLWPSPTSSSSSPSPSFS